MSVLKSQIWQYDGTVDTYCGSAVVERCQLPPRLTVHDFGLQLAGQVGATWAMLSRSEAEELLRELAAALDFAVISSDALRWGDKR